MEGLFVLVPVAQAALLLLFGFPCLMLLLIIIRHYHCLEALDCFERRLGLSIRSVTSLRL